MNYAITTPSNGAIVGTIVLSNLISIVAGFIPGITLG
jgi:hypothetical protein